MSFVPSTTDEPRPMGKYLKLNEDGQWRLRVLAPFFAFDAAWKDGKPIRKPLGATWGPDEFDAVNKFGKPGNPARAWAGPAFVYKFQPDIGNGRFGLATQIGKVLVWEIKQPSIRQRLDAIVNGGDGDWSDPTAYDLLVTRYKGKNGMVCYNIDTTPHKPISDEVAAAWDAVCAFGAFDIKRLLENGDPFGDAR